VSRYVFKLPDLGEGTVEAEIVAWHVKPGDTVAEEDVIVEVMTDKASVEVPAPVSGRVLSTTGAPGDMVPVGAVLIAFETDVGAAAEGAPAAPAAQAAGGPAAAMRTTAAQAPAAAASAEGAASAGSASAARASATPAPAARGSGAGASAPAARAGGGAAPAGPASAGAARTGAAPVGSAATAGSVAAGPASASTARTGGASGSAAAAGSAAATSAATTRAGNGAANGHAHTDRPGRIATSPAIRRRAHEAGVDLTQLAGSGPNGRILRQDFEAFVSSRSGPKLVRSRPAGHRVPDEPQSDEPQTEEIKVIGLRRMIAQRMSEAKRNIPHFAYVEEFDVTELESLRRHLNGKLEPGTPTLTYLPFIVSALIRVLHDFPQCNALYDSERGVLIRHRAVHVGVATQTPEGLKVPVVHNAQSLGLWDLAAQMRRVTEAARSNKASRDELSGSTITVTSLGKLGGIASTPIINAPEVSIIGINRAVERPMVYEGAITIRRMMNLSSSFDHRFVDGHDAAAMIQALKERIEHPATIFID
jgi:2-oxoisovalerate dehydrogenase E2 component (dihydrolipoyl transacylase)